MVAHVADRTLGWFCRFAFTVAAVFWIASSVAERERVPLSIRNLEPEIRNYQSKGLTRSDAERAAWADARMREARDGFGISQGVVIRSTQVFGQRSVRYETGKSPEAQSIFISLEAFDRDEAKREYCRVMRSLPKDEKIAFKIALRRIYQKFAPRDLDYRRVVWEFVNDKSVSEVIAYAKTLDQEVRDSAIVRLKGELDEAGKIGDGETRKGKTEEIARAIEILQRSELLTLDAGPAYYHEDC